MSLLYVDYFKLKTSKSQQKQGKPFCHLVTAANYSRSSELRGLLLGLPWIQKPRALKSLV